MDLGSNTLLMQQTYIAFAWSIGFDVSANKQAANNAITL